MFGPLPPILWLSLYVSGVALALATVAGVPLGAGLALYRVPGRRLIELLIYTGMGLPPVVVGLVVYLLLSRSGPLGALEWLFTPAGMITAQVIIALPVVIGLTFAAVESVDPALRLQVRALGATGRQVMWAVLAEARTGVLAAIVLETRKGNFELALALGGVLLTLALAANALLLRLGQRRLP